MFFSAARYRRSLAKPRFGTAGTWNWRSLEKVVQVFCASVNGYGCLAWKFPVQNKLISELNIQLFSPCEGEARINLANGAEWLRQHPQCQAPSVHVEWNSLATPMEVHVLMSVCGLLDGVFDSMKADGAEFWDDLNVCLTGLNSHHLSLLGCWSGYGCSK